MQTVLINDSYHKILDKRRIDISVLTTLTSQKSKCLFAKIIKTRYNSSSDKTCILI